MKAPALTLAVVVLFLAPAAFAQDTGSGALGDAPKAAEPEAPEENPEDGGAEASASEGSAKDAPAAEVHRFERKALGTDVQILVYTADASGAEAAANAAFEEIARIDGLMSSWNEGSEVSKLNAAAGGAPVSISADTHRVLSLAKEISAKSGGAFASTWATLSGLWNFEIPEGQAPILPDKAALEEKMKLVDDSKLVLTDDSAKLAEKGMVVGLGGITKGHAVDEALRVIKEKGFDDVLVFVGGDIASSGRKGALPWVVGLQEPRADGYFALVTLEDEAIATSGDYEAFFEFDGKRYHHLLDPRTGYPAFGSRSVSVLAKDAASADAYATAIFVLGPEDGLELAESTPGLEAVIVDAENQVTVSTGLAKRLRILHQPVQ